MGYDGGRSNRNTHQKISMKSLELKHIKGYLGHFLAFTDSTLKLFELKRWKNRHTTEQDTFKTR